MKALAFRRFGGPEVLEYVDVPEPVVGPGQALVELRAIGLNFADLYRRQGRYHLAGVAPWIAGYEGCGRVLALHGTDPEIDVGQRVAFADAPYANAQRVAVDVDRLIPVPPGIDDVTAAAVLLQGLTAQYLIRDSYRVCAGDVAVVLAAGGGVGLLLTQLLAHAGARVVAVASSEEKRSAARAAGAELTLDDVDWSARVVELTVGRGADVVYDSVGRTLPDSLRCTRVGGTVVFYGMAGGDPAPIDPRLLMDRSLSLVGGDLWNVLADAQVRRTRAADVFSLVARGALTVRVARTFSLEQGADAHRLLESRAVIGKVVLLT